jgi:hypothetical protein
VTLYASTDDESSISTSDQGVLGAVGSVAALITLYSEFTLANTGCGLPAGPLGLVGLAEGLSYLGIVGIVGYSLFTKVKTVRHLVMCISGTTFRLAFNFTHRIPLPVFLTIQRSGLPAGPAGLLGAAEGLSYLAILAGIVVLALQLTNYGFIPNAVPMEGGMCS